MMSAAGDISLDLLDPETATKAVFWTCAGCLLMSLAGGRLPADRTPRRGGSLRSLLLHQKIREPEFRQSVDENQAEGFSPCKRDDAQRTASRVWYLYMRVCVFVTIPICMLSVVGAEQRQFIDPCITSFRKYKHKAA